MEIPPKTENRPTMWPNNSTSGYLSKGKEIIVSKRYLPFRVNCNLTYNSQDVVVQALTARKLEISIKFENLYFPKFFS